MFSMPRLLYGVNGLMAIILRKVCIRVTIRIRMPETKKMADAFDLEKLTGEILKC